MAASAYMKNLYRQRRSLVVDSLGGVCAKCGTTNRLHADHVNPQTKSFDLMANYGIKLSRFLNEMAKCQLLCISCHSKKTNKETKPSAVGTHGTLSSYRYCGPPKCDRCKAAKRTHQAARRASRKVI